MQTVEGFDFQPLTFNREGKPEAGPGIQELIDHARASSTTDVIFLAHGFRNSETEALTLYGNFLRTFRAHMNRPELKPALKDRRFAVAGVLWPSKSFSEVDDLQRGGAQSVGDDSAEREVVRARLLQLRDEDASPEARPRIDRALALLPLLDDNPDAQDEFVDSVLSILDEAENDPTEGLQQVRAQAGSELLDKLATPVILPTTPSGEDEGGVGVIGGMPPATGVALGIGDVFTTISGRIGHLLNLTTWYLMKERSATVGAAGVADAVRSLKASRPTVKIHLVGHSLGGRLVAGTAKALCSAPVVKLDSLTLLEAAFSHYGFSANNGQGSPGFFRDVVARSIVAGPFVSTFSFEDTVVGKAYAVASRLAGDNTKAVGDANDPFGGIGRNGAQKTTESFTETLHAPGTPYEFRTGVVTNLDGSGGLIKDHGDVTNANVTYAFASAVARS